MLSTITPPYFNLLNKRIKEIRFFKNVNTGDILKKYVFTISKLFHQKNENSRDSEAGEIILD